MTISSRRREPGRAVEDSRRSRDQHPKTSAEPAQLHAKPNKMINAAVQLDVNYHDKHLRHY
jgi:hypothetical protein